MIIESIPHGAIPYKCNTCKSIYLWKPVTEKEYCEFTKSTYMENPKCDKKEECIFFEAQLEPVRCPVCKTKYCSERINPFRYKLLRALYLKR